MTRMRDLTYDADYHAALAHASRGWGWAAAQWAAVETEDDRIARRLVTQALGEGTDGANRANGEDAGDGRADERAGSEHARGAPPQ